MRKIAAVTINNKPMIIESTDDNWMIDLDKTGEKFAVAYDTMYGTMLHTGEKIWTGDGYICNEKYVMDMTKGRTSEDCIAAIVNDANRF